MTSPPHIEPENLSILRRSQPLSVVNIEDRLRVTSDGRMRRFWPFLPEVRVFRHD